MNACGKMRVFDQMMEALLAKGHKILIFSQMTRMLDILGDYLGYKVRMRLMKNVKPVSLNCSH